jgi:O-antigen ligase
MLAAAVSIAAIAMVTSRFGNDISLQKWTRLTQGGLVDDGRWAVYLTCRQWFGEVPTLGFGPGTFARVFYAKTATMRDAPPGFWEFAHNDYLQTFFDWGWSGLLLWTAIGGFILAGMILAASKAAQGEKLPLQISLISVSMALLSVALHAAVDFPLQIFAIQFHVAALSGIGVAMVSQVGGSTGASYRRERKRRPGKRSERETHAGAP